MSLLAAAILAVGCTEDLTTDEINPEGVVKTEFMEVTATLECDEAAEESRTTLTDGGNGGKVVWSEGDTIGAVSADGTITECAAKDIDGEKATFEVPTDTKYAVYPYATGLTFSASSKILEYSLPSEFTADGSKKVFGDKQNVSFAHLLDGDLQFRNLCGYVEVKLKGTQKVKHVALRNNSGNWDALSGNGMINFSNTEAPAFNTGTDHGSTFNFVYAKCADVQLSAEATSFYFIVPPRTYENMSICVTTDKGSYSVIADNAITVNRSKIRPLAAIDIDQLAATNATNLAAEGVSNCYVVPQGAEAKYYSFPARKINGTANLEGVAYAHVSWSESATLVDNVCYDAATGNVTFKYEGNNAEGNVQICVLNEKNEILWSYHIWCTDQPQMLSISSGATKYGVLDRNIGATYTPTTPAEATNISVADASDAMGLYYQYGRPTPFPRIKDATINKESAAYGNNTRVAVQYAFAKYNQLFTFSTSVNSYETALRYPKAFYTVYYSAKDGSESTYSSSSTSYDTWYGKEVYNPFTDREKLWFSEDADVVSKKSDNDPCPVGYVVDEQVGAAAYMGGKTYTTVKQSVTSSNNAVGYWAQCASSEAVIWLPAQGFRGRGSAIAQYIGANYNLWTAFSQTAQNNLNCVRISGGNPSFNAGYLQASQGFGIRCRAIDRTSLQGTASVDGFEGQGTEASPYLIKTASDMLKLSGLCNGSMSAAEGVDYTAAYYALAGNLDMSSAELTPIAPFKGVFDGKGFTISNVKIVPAAGQPSGIFGELVNATVKNVNIENSLLNVTSNDLHTGGIAGKATGSTITNCNFNGTVMSACSASFVSTSGTNGASAVVGGIVAYAINTTVSNCNISGTIEASKGQFTGGVAGHFEGGKIDNCKILNGTYLYSSMNHTAGIAGRITCDAEVTNCVVDAPVICGYATNGGIVGRMQSGIISNCLVTSNSEIIGHKNQSAVSYTDTGGLVGIVQTAANMGTKAIIKDCACYANVSANTYVGGLFGQLKATAGTCEVNVVNCLFKGHVTCVSKNTYNYGVAAGIVGSSNNGATMDKTNLVNCVALVDGISFNSSATAAGFGGLIGYAKHTDTYASYTNLEIADIVSQEGKAIAEYSSLKNWGALFGLGHGDTTMCKFSDVYYSSVGDKIGATASGTPTYTNTEGMTSTQMTDGTLLAKLNAAVTTWNSTAASNLQASTWVAGADGYPVPSTVPADTGSAATNVKKTRVSLIGDSISTFKGWMPSGYNSFYPISTNPTVISATQTYWYKLIYKYMSNATLEKNIAWTGTVVARSTDANYLATDHGAGHCFVERFRDDGMGDPDVILLHGGTNDVGNRGVTIAVHPNYPTYGGSGYQKTMCPTDAEMSAVYATADAATTWDQLVALNDTSFVEAYTKLLSMMHFKHPNAKVVMIIGDWIHEGTRQAILKIAKHYGDKYGYKCVDLQEISPYNSYDVIPKESGCHPNEAGFEVMADYIYKKAGSYIDPKN